MMSCAWKIDVNFSIFTDNLCICLKNFKSEIIFLILINIRIHHHPTRYTGLTDNICICRKNLNWNNISYSDSLINVPHSPSSYPFHRNDNIYKIFWQIRLQTEIITLILINIPHLSSSYPLYRNDNVDVFARKF